jgi:uncharacterized RDD family membrane protein YckC
MNYANWIQRVGASIIDALPVIVLEIIVLAVGSAVVRVLFWLIALGITIYNRWIQAGSTGQSWGKKVVGLRLIGVQTGQPIGAGMAFLRDLCHIVDSIICYVGYLFPLWDSKRQTLADKIVSTVVVTV